MAGLTRNYLKLYAVVSNDEFELPMCIGTIHEISEYLGITANRVRVQMSVHDAPYNHKWASYFKIINLNLKERVGNGCIEKG